MADLRRVTLDDVARAAGVSTSTASRALNGVGELADETRAAVLAVASDLGFQPSPIGRSLRTRKTLTVGFVVPDLATPFFAACLKGAARTLGAHGYRVIAMDSDRDVVREEEAVRTLLGNRVDGLLLSTTGLTAPEFSRLMQGWSTPCVFFDGILPGEGLGSVTLDNRGGMQALVEHLTSHGHDRIVHIRGPQSESSAVERSEAFRHAMKRAGFSERDAEEVLSPWDRESARRVAHRVLEGASPPTAIVASSDDIALGCLRACRETGVSVPRDLALVSFDDPYYGEMLEPSLTALRVDPSEIGARASELLVAGLQEPGPTESEDGQPVTEVRIPLRLVRRYSCGCDEPGPETGGRG
jgi:LacI family transcriptional regulator